MKGGRARRASVSGAAPQPVGEAVRMRKLTGGGTAWPGRRCATLSGGTGEAARLVEACSDGRPRQRTVCAYSTEFSGARATSCANKG
jgi:hypothetical protein